MTSKIGLISSFFLLIFFLFSHTYTNYVNAISDCFEIWYTEGGITIKAHLGTNFGWNTINRQRGIRDFSRKITPICCHAYSVNQGQIQTIKKGGSILELQLQPSCKLKTKKKERKKKKKKKKRSSPADNSYPSP